MTQNRRIVLNIVATYGIPRAKRAAKQALCGVRSVYGAVLGLFASIVSGDCGGGVDVAAVATVAG